ncbi:MAG: thiamine diphosphokinase [Clostridia bacterium]|nr:thiamine diphosphokinase [Clostridia bacterium]MBQ7380344.1 thiamine diphosphokinase [Clostridia bacterium]
MRAFIYVGGSIYPENITEHPKGEDLRIAADGGYANAKLLGERIDIAVGDFDSFSRQKIDEGVELVELPAEKDLTDSQVCIETAISRGADEIILIGGLSGRLDHTLANLAILQDLHARHIHGYITDGQNRAHYIRSTSHLIARSAYKYLSLIAVDETCKGVSIKGCKYELKNQPIHRRLQFAVSNEITSNCALISVKKGGLYVIESREQ